MASLYQTDGRVREVRPSNGTRWTRIEMELLVGGPYELGRTLDGRYMVINDTGKLRGLELNIPATRIYLHGRKDPLVGDVLVVDSLSEVAETA